MKRLSSTRRLARQEQHRDRADDRQEHDHVEQVRPLGAPAPPRAVAGGPQAADEQRREQRGGEAEREALRRALAATDDGAAASQRHGENRLRPDSGRWLDLASGIHRRHLRSADGGRCATPGCGAERACSAAAPVTPRGGRADLGAQLERPRATCDRRRSSPRARTLAATAPLLEVERDRSRLSPNSSRVALAVAVGVPAVRVAEARRGRDACTCPSPRRSPTTDRWRAARRRTSRCATRPTTITAA